MAVLPVLFLLVGSLLVLASGLAILVVAFQESALWGVLCLVFGPALFVFSALHWYETQKLMIGMISGMALIGLGAVIA